MENAGEGAAFGGGASAPSQDSFVCHPSSHLLLHEERAYEKVLGFDAVPLGVMEVSSGLSRWGGYLLKNCCLKHVHLFSNAACSRHLFFLQVIASNYRI